MCTNFVHLQIYNVGIGTFDWYANAIAANVEWLRKGSNFIILRNVLVLDIKSSSLNSISIIYSVFGEKLLNKTILSRHQDWDYLIIN